MKDIDSEYDPKVLDHAEEGNAPFNNQVPINMFANQLLPTEDKIEEAFNIDMKQLKIKQSVIEKVMSKVA